MTHQKNTPALPITDIQQFRFFENNLFNGRDPRNHESWPGFIAILRSKKVDWLGIKKNGQKKTFYYCCGEPSCECDELINVSEEFVKVGEPEAEPDLDFLHETLQPLISLAR